MRKIFYSLLVCFCTNIIYAQELQLNPTVFCSQVMPPGILMPNGIVTEGGEILLRFQSVDSNANFKFKHYNFIAKPNEIKETVGTITDRSINELLISPLSADYDPRKTSIAFEIEAVFDNGTPNGHIEYANANTIHLRTLVKRDNIVTLNWNNLYSSMSGIVEQEYIVRRYIKDYDNDFIVVGRVKPEDVPSGYNDTLPHLCNNDVFYDIVLKNNETDCLCASNMQMVNESDRISPEKPTILSNSVDVASQKIVIEWEPSTTFDTYGYYILKDNKIIDSVAGADKSKYICSICDVSKVNSIKIFARDTCFNSSENTEILDNIVLKFTREKCSARIKFEWNRYTDNNFGVKTYRILGREKGGMFTVLDVADADKSSIIIDVNPAVQEYDFYLEAVNASGKKVCSNMISSSLEGNASVKFLNIRSTAIHQDNKHVDLSIFLDSTLVIKEYEIHRVLADDVFSSTTLLAKIPYSGKGTLKYTDLLPTPASKDIYKYRLEAVDACGLYKTKSNAVSTIRLKSTELDAEQNYIEWSPFEGWTSVQEYDVVRVMSSDNKSNVIGSVVTNDLTYNDNLATNEDMLLAERVTYYVVAREAGIGIDGKKAESVSSRATIKKETLIWVPNSFMPTAPGDNNKFKPICNYIRKGSYKFKIFNRWGTILFSSTNPDEAWDGTYKGKICAPESYFYSLEFISSDGQKIQRGGTVNLIN